MNQQSVRIPAAHVHFGQMLLDVAKGVGDRVRRAGAQVRAGTNTTVWVHVWACPSLAQAGLDAGVGRRSGRRPGPVGGDGPTGGRRRSDGGEVLVWVAITVVALGLLAVAGAIFLREVTEAANSVTLQ